MNLKRKRLKEKRMQMPMNSLMILLNKSKLLKLILNLGLLKTHWRKENDSTTTF